ncbi:MAG: cytosine permease [Streptosporangiaceae bacterium]
MVLHQYRGTTLSSGPILIATIGLFFMNMLSWASYGSDYSRYLPRDISFQRTFWAIFGGNVVLLFFSVPWSAINLVDYYLVKRGRYDVASFFTPNGVYGRIQWWACICYVITLAVQVPFLDQPFFVGSLVKPLGGADISWIVGFALASLLYLAGARRFDGSRRCRPRPPAAAAAGSAS